MGFVTNLKFKDEDDGQFENQTLGIQITPVFNGFVLTHETEDDGVTMVYEFQNSSDMMKYITEALGITKTC